MLMIFVSRLKAILALKNSVALLIVITLFMISGCSPHKGAGNWKADTKNSHNINMINISFEGNADFYSENKEESIRRCFWSAVAENTMNMQCVYSENTDNTVIYQFVVIEKGHAKLSLDDQLIAEFTLQKPEKEATFW